MLRWSFVFFVCALVAAFFGFGDIAATAADNGKVLFYGFGLVAVVSLIIGLVRDSSSNFG